MSALIQGGKSRMWFAPSNDPEQWTEIHGTVNGPVFQIEHSEEEVKAFLESEQSWGMQFEEIVYDDEKRLFFNRIVRHFYRIEMSGRTVGYLELDGEENIIGCWDETGKPLPLDNEPERL